jgi:neuronal cell adhesion protein
VKEETRILSGPKDYEAEAGSTATFRCHAEHDLSLPLRITWFKDGQYIHVNANNRFVQSSDHSLAITRTTEMDSGTYTCKVSTKIKMQDKILRSKFFFFILDNREKKNPSF